MGRQSAGLLLYRRGPKGVEIFLVHPGGPYWQGKEAGAWSIPKGEFSEGEEPLAAACREFGEETGSPVRGPFRELKPVRQKAGKTVYAWAAEGDLDASAIRSNYFRQEYPYKSGKWQLYPEVDKAAWFSPEEARLMINPAQAAFIDELLLILAGTTPPSAGQAIFE